MRGGGMVPENGHTIDYRFLPRNINAVASAQLGKRVEINELRKRIIDPRVNSHCNGRRHWQCIEAAMATVRCGRGLTRPARARTLT